MEMRENPKMKFRYVSTVLKNTKVNSSVSICRLSVPKNFDYIPGQYIFVYGTDKEKNRIKRSYSISSKKNSKFIELCVKKVDKGPISNFIFNLKKGDKLEIFGPVGGFYIKETSRNKPICLVCNGTGIGPFISILSDLLSKKSNKKVILIAGFRNESDILYEKELELIKKQNPNFNYYFILSQPQKNYGNIGYVQDFLKKFEVITKNYDFYLCGLNEMIESVTKKLISSNIPKEKIFYEKYD